MLIEAGSGCIDEDLVGRCIESDHARWSASIGREVFGIGSFVALDDLEGQRLCCEVTQGYGCGHGGRGINRQRSARRAVVEEGRSRRGDLAFEARIPSLITAATDSYTHRRTHGQGATRRRWLARV